MPLTRLSGLALATQPSVSRTSRTRRGTGGWPLMLYSKTTWTKSRRKMLWNYRPTRRMFSMCHTRATHLTPSRSGLGRPLKLEESIRRRKLLADPMLDLINPRLVKCRKCGGLIKLSMKSLYDPQHWTRHRGRCLKKRGKDREVGGFVLYIFPRKCLIRRSPH